MKAFDDELEKHFEVTHGSADWVLGIHIQRDLEQGTASMSQQKYIESLLVKYGLQDMSTKETPADPNQHLEVKQESDERLNENDTYLFKQIVGALLYLAVCTRPDIAEATRSVASCSAEPTKRHLIAAKRILRYLKHTISHKLTYTKPTLTQITGYVDANWAEDKANRKSVTGYAFFISGGAIVWKSKQQTSITLSSCEAEYTALAAAIQETVYLLQLVESAEIPLDNYTINLLEDNQSAIALARNPLTSSRTKHVDIRLHFVREILRRGSVVLHHCPTSKMVADILTKSLAKVKFKHLATQLLGLTAHEYVFVPERLHIEEGVSTYATHNK